MKIIESTLEWKAYCRALRAKGPLGFVPTMGNLHNGHLSLVKHSQSKNTATCMSIFINPTQFNRQEDLENYPKTLDADIAALEALGVDACWLPMPHELYHDNYHYRVEEMAFSHALEGPFRPGHFTGVLTVVMKLLCATQARYAYFGEKDYQQYQLVKGMAEAFFLDTEIMACPTIREADGLPYSSRNSRLTPKQREKAGIFAKIFHQKHCACNVIKEKLEAEGIVVEYIEDYNERRFIAVLLDNIRLIDNYPT